MKLSVSGARPASIPPPLPTAQLYTVATTTGLRLCALATSADEACGKVHGAVSAWLGFEPLSNEPCNDNAAELGDEDVIAWAIELGSP